MKEDSMKMKYIAIMLLGFAANQGISAMDEADLATAQQGIADLEAAGERLDEMHAKGIPLPKKDVEVFMQAAEEYDKALSE